MRSAAVGPASWSPANDPLNSWTPSGGPDRGHDMKRHRMLGLLSELLRMDGKHHMTVPFRPGCLAEHGRWTELGRNHGVGAHPLMQDAARGGASLG